MARYRESGVPRPQRWMVLVGAGSAHCSARLLLNHTSLKTAVIFSIIITTIMIIIISTIFTITRATFIPLPFVLYVVDRSILPLKFIPAASQSGCMPLLCAWIPSRSTWFELLRGGAVFGGLFTPGALVDGCPRLCSVLPGRIHAPLLSLPEMRTLAINLSVTLTQNKPDLSRREINGSSPQHVEYTRHTQLQQLSSPL
ncbi:hypothetical protein Q8A73_021085 [Channa argus]|nr:hypothetical protein Q8A73_021085 [Channa argus]